MPRTYFLGNSLTDHFTADSRTYNPNGPAIERICVEAGLPKWEHGGKNIAGAPLWWHWYNAKDGGRGLASGRYCPEGPTEALGKLRWDQITFQAHGGTQLVSASTRDEKLKTGVVIPAGAPRGDVAMCTNFRKKALKNPENADMQVYVYSTWVRWPRDARAKLAEGKPLDPGEADYEALWLAQSDPPTMHTQQYFVALMNALNEKRAADLAGLKKPVLMIPAGDVLLALDRKLKSGELADLDPTTDWKDIRDAFQPGLGVHVNPMGQVVVSYIFYATLLGRSPEGLDMRSLLREPNETDLNLSDEQIRIIQKTVWDVVSSHPYALATSRASVISNR
jgi:hypothetical protein